MRDKKQLEELLNKIFHSSEQIFGDALCAVILYGSYARGDYDAGSDIDIMVLTDTDRSAIKPHADALKNIAWELGMDYNIPISVHVNNTSWFHRWREDMPFYRNVWNDGRLISA
jgi:predicted nucleotidyltransferase